MQLGESDVHPCGGIAESAVCGLSEFASLGTIISAEAAVGPATEIETKSLFDPNFAANAFKNVFHACLYTEFQGRGKVVPSTFSEKPAKVTVPQSTWIT
jgi:hypothetical protein